MTIKTYIESCIKFAAETKNWGDMYEYSHYTTDGIGGWEESCDNAHGGLDVSWAFHESPEYIKAEAPQRFVDEIAAQLEQAIDEGWDTEQLGSLLEMVK